jgi:2-dehydro-3-deoxygluconokinase
MACPEKTLDLIGLGEPLGEFNATRGEPGQFQFGFGGDVCNTVIAAARQGLSTAMFTAMGEDETGAAFKALWRTEGVDVSQVRFRHDAPTGLYFVTHGEQGHVFSYRRAGSAASLMTPQDIDADLIARARVLYASGISQAISSSACDTVFAAFEIARAAGTLIAYDTNLRLKLWPLARARAIIEAAAAQADILRPSLDDAVLLTGKEEPRAIVDHYLDKGAKVVALTMGRRGCLIATPDHQETLAPISVDAVDATGAGDTFGGAFIAEYIRTGDAVTAGRYANLAAALSTRGYGAVAPIPRRAEVEARLKALEPA